MDNQGWFRRMPAMQRVLPFVSLLLIIVGLLVVWVAGVQRPYLTDDFSYSADIVTTDNAYDTVNQRYSGDRYSRGKIYYNLENNTDGTAAIRSVWDISDVSGGKTVAKISRERQVAVKTGLYEPDGSDPNEDEYLFAPSNLKPHQNFTYRHLIYDAPAIMHYAGEDTLYGLRVFRYTASYAANMQLQENDIPATNLPANQGLEYHPQLQVWIEPVTGWLIKFADTGTLSAYDKVTGKDLGPYNKYAVHFTDASVLQQVSYARSLKKWYMVVQRVVPGVLIAVLLGIALVLLLWRMRTVALPIRVLVGLAFALCGVGLIGWALHSAVFTTLLWGDVGITPPAALCFVATAICLLLIYSQRLRWLQLALSSAVFSGGVITLLVAVHLTPATRALIQQDSAVSSLNQSAAHISAYAACTFILLGVALLKAAYIGRRRKTALQIAAFTAAMVMALGLVGLLLQLLQIDETFAVSLAYPLSGITSFMFILSGYTLLVVVENMRGESLAFRSLARLMLQPALLSLPLVIIGTVAQFKQNQVQGSLQSSFVGSTTVIQDTLKDKLDSYGQLLTGAQALFASSHSVEPDEWHSFISTYQLSSHFPGIVNAGYAATITPSQAPGFIAARRAAGLANYTLYPTTTHGSRTPITYLEPNTAEQQKLLGYDMFTDEVRSAAMEQASTNATISITPQVNLLPTTTDSPTGFMLFLPVYQNGAPTATATEREAALQGYVFLSISLQELVQNALGSQPHNIAFAIYDGTQADSAALLYNSGVDSASLGARLTERTNVYLFGHPWTIAYRALPSFRLSEAQERAPAVILLAGGAAYIVVLTLAYSLIAYRRRLNQAKRNQK